MDGADHSLQCRCGPLSALGHGDSMAASGWAGHVRTAEPMAGCRAALGWGAGRVSCHAQGANHE
ncbi:hypothetical protein ARZXY2_1950 [Arthrobacter sp. ZXY-2]|nr:hypothetical protein ARZXY2_1950 [Arthrobacter sp. ZXY-2]